MIIMCTMLIHFNAKVGMGEDSEKYVGIYE